MFQLANFVFNFLPISNETSLVFFRACFLPISNVPSPVILEASLAFYFLF